MGSIDTGAIVRLRQEHHVYSMAAVAIDSRRVISAGSVGLVTGMVGGSALRTATVVNEAEGWWAYIDCGKLELLGDVRVSEWRAIVAITGEPVRIFRANTRLRRIVRSAGFLGWYQQVQGAQS